MTAVGGDMGALRPPDGISWPTRTGHFLRQAGPFVLGCGFSSAATSVDLCRSHARAGTAR